MWMLWPFEGFFPGLVTLQACCFAAEGDYLIPRLARYSFVGLESKMEEIVSGRHCGSRVDNTCSPCCTDLHNYTLLVVVGSSAKRTSTGLLTDYGFLESYSYERTTLDRKKLARVIR